jgi:hypothetical protein
MNPKNSEIFPKLILPLDSIVLEDSLASGNSLASEDFLVSEDFFASEKNFTSEYSLPPQKIDVDPLTRMAKDPPVNPRGNDYTVPPLKDARLHIGMDSIGYRVTATVRVELSRYEMNLINNGGGLVLQSSGWGIDNPIFDTDNTFYRRNFDTTDDDLFYFPDQNITRSGIYSFSTVVPRSVLNEDRWQFNERDEIDAKISLLSYHRTSPLNLTTRGSTRTNIVKDFFY